MLLGILFPQEMPLVGKHYTLVWLPSLRPVSRPVVKPPLRIAQAVTPKLRPARRPEIAVLPVAVPRLPKVRPAMSTAAARIPEPPKPEAPAAQPRPAPKVEMAVNTGVFGGAPEPITTKRPAEQVQTGGFGSPQGFQGQAHGDSAGTVPKLGSFGLPDGPGVGNGTGGAHGIRGVVASAGFGSGVAGSGSPRGAAGISTGAFETVAQTTLTPPRTVQAPKAESFQPVEIFSKPAPVYTEEARHMGIQGEVALSVVFEASGEIRVLGVIRSLGHGLDQAAQQAAALIRFKPALRDGKPADFPATLRIEFRLADQAT